MTKLILLDSLLQEREMETGMGRGRFIKEIRERELFQPNMAQIPNIIATTQDASHLKLFVYESVEVNVS